MFKIEEKEEIFLNVEREPYICLFDIKFKNVCAFFPKSIGQKKSVRKKSGQMYK
jgi:hypothetical protein